jgi:predicted transcriptional regulator of viral defense system
MSSRAAEARVRRAAAKHGAVLRAAHLFDAGLHPRDLYALRDAGHLETIARGIYRIASAPPPAHVDLLVVATRAPHAVVCLTSALAFHELTDEIPHEVTIAIPRNAAAPRLDTPPVRVFRFSDVAYRLGIEHHALDRVDVKIYSPTKSIVDAFRFRNRIGEDVAIKALSEALRSRRVRPGPLLELASKLRARTVIEPYVKALA